MKLEYTVCGISPSDERITLDEYEYWLILLGNGQLSSEQGNLGFVSHDVLELPYQISFQLKSEEPLLIGKIILTDFHATNRTIRKIEFPSTDLIRKTFYFALDLKGSHHLNSADMQNSADQILLQSLFSNIIANPKKHPAVYPIIDAINQHYTEPDFDVNPYISQTGYSKNYIRKLFLDEIGIPPIAYIQQRRLEQAKKLLKESPAKTLREIAFESGFSDVYYFSRLFRQKNGMSPSEYIKQNRIPDKTS